LKNSIIYTRIIKNKLIYKENKNYERGK